MKNRVAAMWRHVWRHIWRSPVKSLLTLGVAMFFLLALAWLQETIIRNAAEIEHMYATTFVTAQVRQVGGDFAQQAPNRASGDLITQRTIDNIREQYFVHHMYYEALTPFNQLQLRFEPIYMHYFDRGEMAFVYDEQGNPVYALTEPHPRNIGFQWLLLAVSDMDAFINDNTTGMAVATPGFEVFMGEPGVDALEITFFEGFNETDFVFEQTGPVPLIVPETVMGYIYELLDLDGFCWDMLYIRHQFPREDEVLARFVIIGTHNRHIFWLDRDLILAPVDALKALAGRNLGYSTLRFTIDPAFNREIGDVQTRVRAVVAHRDAGHGPITAIFNDDVLTNVVVPMEDNLSLLEVLYPVAVAIAFAIGAGLAALMTMQNAKNAAIIRVLGASKKKTGALLTFEIALVCIGGLGAGLAVTAALWGAAPFAIALIYLAGAVLGAVVGVFFVTTRPPMSLLQVRE